MGYCKGLPFRITQNFCFFFIFFQFLTSTIISNMYAVLGFIVLIALADTKMIHPFGKDCLKTCRLAHNPSNEFGDTPAKKAAWKCVNQCKDVSCSAKCGIVYPNRGEEGINNF